MYARKVDGRETTFGVSGSLWRDSLIFYDRASTTFWSQVAGQAIGGPHEGEQLKEVPSVLSTWGEWKRLHPDTLVLRKPEKGGSPYTRYFDDPERLGVFGRENPDDRMPGKAFVLGMTVGREKAVVPMKALRDGGLVQANVAKVPLVVAATGPDDAEAFDRRVGSRVLDFEPIADGRLKDSQTGSVWHRETGLALEGELKGSTLSRIDSRRMYWFIWATFHPGSRILEG